MPIGPRNASISPEALAAIRVVFFEECDEHLAVLETGLMDLLDNPDDPETVNTIFRAVHSVKGSAGIFDFADLVAFAHQFESALDQVRSGAVALHPGLLKILLRATDALNDLVKAARDGVDLKADYIAGLLDELSDMAPAVEDFEFDELSFTPVPVELDVPDAVPAVEGGLTVTFRPHAGLYAKANEPLPLFAELARLGAVETTLDQTGLPLLDVIDPDESYLSWSLRLTTDASPTQVREVFEFVEGDCELVLSTDEPAPAINEPEGVIGEPPETVGEPVAEPVQQAAAASAASAPTAAAQPTIRVDLDRIDRMIDLVSELVINQAMLAQRVSQEQLAGHSEISTVLDDLDQLTRELQDSVMAIRAQPVKSVFQRMSRLVREVEAVTGKPVRLVTEGEGVEVDRTVIERLADPLTHMVRNAIDHGLETPEARAAAGKPPEGTVRISAAHRAGRILIEVSDDGAGIDRDRVRAKAVERGIITADAPLTEDDVDNLIFAPGFSTADAISGLSGRGVGMDVVRTSVQALGGRISVRSVKGEGSTFTLSLPLTLAIMDGMLVSVGGQTLVAPLTMLVESFQVAPGDVRRLGPSTGILTIRGAHVPLLDLGEVLGYPRLASTGERAVALLVEDDKGQPAALLVDEIQGQKQVVIKSLEANYRQVPGIAAATILGDGRVALILDINSILHAHRRYAAEAQAA